MVNIIFTLFLSTSLSLIMFILGWILKKKQYKDQELQSPFECGFSTYNEFRLNFSLRFFLIALIFLLFDVELIIMFPFFNKSELMMDTTSLILFTLFTTILTLGLFNEWNQMMLEWSK